MSYYYGYSEPAYYYDPSPEPVYGDFYQDTSSDTAYYVDTPQYDELEAYAEIRSQRTYTEDEIHPAYRDHPDDHLQYDPDPSPLTELYTEDEIHPAYRDPPDVNYYEPIQSPTTYTTEPIPLNPHTPPTHSMISLTTNSQNMPRYTKMCYKTWSRKELMFHIHA